MNKELLMIDSKIVTPAQVQKILGDTPPERVKFREGAFGKKVAYVEGSYVKDKLNHIFGMLWDFEIKDKGTSGQTFWVHGKLTIKSADNDLKIVKEQFGSSAIKCKKGTQIPVDLGNDMKAAATDALKKCAADLGIAHDVYTGKFKTESQNNYQSQGILGVCNLCKKKAFKTRDGRPCCPDFLKHKEKGESFTIVQEQSIYQTELEKRLNLPA